MPTPTTNYSFNIPTVGADDELWGGFLNVNWTALDTLLFSGTVGAATTGNAATATKWATARDLTINGVTQSVDGTANAAWTIPTFPTGGIIMWSGSIASIPAGWLLCDGTNGTPDLRSRFVVGAGSTYNPGDTGGVDSVTLTTAQIPSHTHTATVNDPGHSHTVDGATQQTNGGGTIITGRNNVVTSSVATTGITVTNAATGGGGSHENRPPYFALAFLMKA
jgi:microcystin-dependent protein